MLVVTLKHEEEGRRVQDDSITIELGMPELRVEGCREVDGGYVVTVRYRAMTRACPRCGQETSHVHQYHRQLKVHTPVWGRRVVLEFRKRRFRRQACGRVFMEPDEVCGVAADGRYVYLAAGNAGLRVLDASDPARIREVCVHDTPGNARRVAVDGGYIYVADDANGLLVLQLME